MRQSEPDWVLVPRTDGREDTPGNEHWRDRNAVPQKEQFFPINRAARRAAKKRGRK